VSSTVSHATDSKPNIVLLTVDALRPDHLGTYGYLRATDQELEPYLDHMAVFRNAYSNSLTTVRSFPSLLCSIWPDLCLTKFFWEGVKQANLPPFCSSLPEVLQHHGYYTAGHTCWVNFLTHKQGFARGFRHFHGFLRQDSLDGDREEGSLFSRILRLAQYEMRYIPSRWLTKLMETEFHWIRETVNAMGLNVNAAPGTAGRSSSAVTDYLLQGISRQKEEPFFVWGHYLDTHFPFSSSEEFEYTSQISAAVRREITQAMFTGRALRAKVSGLFTDLYDAAVRTAIHQVRRVLDFLQEEGLLDRTCVIITSDHGQGFREHGYWECPDGEFYDESIRIPLMIYNSKLLAMQKNIDAAVSLMDLAPTLLDLSGLPPEDCFWGQSFADLLGSSSPTTSGRTVWIETLGPPRRICRIWGAQKVVYNLDARTVSYGLDEQDERVPPEQVDPGAFLQDLQNLLQDREAFLDKLTR